MDGQVGPMADCTKKYVVQSQIGENSEDSADRRGGAWSVGAAVKAPMSLQDEKLDTGANTLDCKSPSRYALPRNRRTSYLEVPKVFGYLGLRLWYSDGCYMER